MGHRQRKSSGLSEGIMFSLIAALFQSLRMAGVWCGWGKKCHKQIADAEEVPRPEDFGLPPYPKCPATKGVGMPSTCNSDILVWTGGPSGNHFDKDQFATGHGNNGHAINGP